MLQRVDGRVPGGRRCLSAIATARLWVACSRGVRWRTGCAVSRRNGRGVSCVPRLAGLAHVNSELTRPGAHPATVLLAVKGMYRLGVKATRRTLLRL